MWGQLGIAVRVASPAADESPWQPGPAGPEVVLFSVHGASLAPMHQLMNQQFVDRAVWASGFSPDGVHLALLFADAYNADEQPGREEGSSTLVLSHFETGETRQFEVHFTAGNFHWGPAGDKVLISEREGSRHLLLDFS